MRRRELLLCGALLPARLPASVPDAIRRDHPRLFFNSDTWPAVKSRALGRDRALFDEMKARVDALPAELGEDTDYGTRAAEAAFVFRATGEARYRERAAQLLEHSAALYVRRHAQKRGVNWYSFSRINAIAAFDWLFNELPEARRKAIARDLLAAVRDAQPTDKRKPFSSEVLIERENWGATRSGFYGTPSLLWFAGVAMAGEGFDDAQAEDFLHRGYQLCIDMLSYRARAAGDDGGSASATLGYLLGAYPWAEFNFFHTYRSATGKDISGQWPHVAMLPNYIYWNWLPGGREFGAGDANHLNNRIPANELWMHLSQMVHFYGKRFPDSAAAAQWIAERVPKRESGAFPYTRFLLGDPPALAAQADFASRLPLARHFENMGQVFFRSGSGADDTYALFAAGGVVTEHKHFDNNHFGIFKKGFLALDTGTRPQPGQHLSHYYCRTVAHNCILIHMPGEQMPSYWGAIPAPGEERLPFPNDGGQQKQLGSQMVAFETRPEYAYAAGDATATYHPDKCRLALRQFVFIAPDWFVIFDRVISADPSFKKTWLLHTIEEPRIEEGAFTADHEEGRLFCRTLLPEAAAVEKMGGPGKQFWSGGRNWPLPKTWRVRDTTPTLGQWRIEVAPRAAAREDFFLHVIHAAGTSLARMAPCALVRDAGRVGARIETPAGAWEVLFGTEGPASGRIRLTRGASAVLDRELTHAVAPQRGLAGR